MKVVQLSKFYKPYCGGLESVVCDISEGIREYGHNVYVISADPDKKVRHEKINSVDVIRSPEMFRFSGVSFAPVYIYDVIKMNDKADVIHIHLPNPLANLAIFIAYYIRKQPCNIIVHWHSDIIKQKKMLRLYMPLMNWLLKKSEKIIVTSERYLKYSEQLKDFKNKSIVVPIGINSIEHLVNKEFSAKLKNKYKGKKIVFSLGRHIYYKGFEFLIKAARNVDNTVFLIGGSGPDTNKYLKLIEKYNLGEKVFLIGRVSSTVLPSYYDAADVFCFPSIEKSEAFGVVQLEAMSVGTPVISTDIYGSGVPWVNKNNVSGLVCKPKCHKSLSESLNKLLFDKDLNDRLAYLSKERFTSMFTKSEMISSINTIYKGLV